MENELQADIRGDSNKPVEGWQELIKLVSAGDFTVLIDVNPELLHKLTGTQLTRLEWKLKLVEKYAAVMAAGMLKGTLKYPQDDISMDKWISSVIGEGADKANYDLLMVNRYNQEKNQQ